MKRFIFLSLLTVTALISGCGKGGQPKAGCVPKMCTMEFVSININFSSYSYSIFTVKDVSAVNLRTGVKLAVNPAPSGPDVPANSYVIAHDSMKDQFSDEGDLVLISGTHSATNQTKTAEMKIAGGCNCHVSKRKTDPSTIMFD
jgi:hypothetical protein